MEIPVTSVYWEKKKIISIGESVCIVTCWYLYKTSAIVFAFLIDFWNFCKQREECTAGVPKLLLDTKQVLEFLITSELHNVRGFVCIRRNFALQTDLGFFFRFVGFGLNFAFDICHLKTVLFSEFFLNSLSIWKSLQEKL